MSEQTIYAPSLTPGYDKRPIRECKRCGGEIVWVESRKTGKFYPATVTKHGSHDARKYGPWNLHRCGEQRREENADADAKAEAVAEFDSLFDLIDRARGRA